MAGGGASGIKFLFTLNVLETKNKYIWQIGQNKFVTDPPPTAPPPLDKPIYFRNLSIYLYVSRGKADSIYRYEAQGLLTIPRPSGACSGGGELPLMSFLFFEGNHEVNLREN